MDEQRELRAEHEKLQKAVDDAVARQEWWSRTVGNPYFAEYLSSCEEEIQKSRVRLEDAEKKSIDGLQAIIRVGKRMVADLRGHAGTASVVEARGRLRRFEDENQLFLQTSSKKR